jgi:hypothetical protein
MQHLQMTLFGQDGWRSTLIPTPPGITTQEENRIREAVYSKFESHLDLLVNRMVTVLKMQDGQRVFARFTSESTLNSYRQRPVTIDKIHLTFDDLGSYIQLIQPGRVQLFGLSVESSFNENKKRITEHHEPCARQIRWNNDPLCKKRGNEAVQHLQFVNGDDAEAMRQTQMSVEEDSVLSFLPGTWTPQRLDEHLTMYKMHGTIDPHPAVGGRLLTAQPGIISFRILKLGSVHYMELLHMTPQDARDSPGIICVQCCRMERVTMREASNVLDSQYLIIFPKDHFMIYVKKYDRSGRSSPVKKRKGQRETDQQVYRALQNKQRDSSPTTAPTVSKHDRDYVPRPTFLDHGNLSAKPKVPEVLVTNLPQPYRIQSPFAEEKNKNTGCGFCDSACCAATQQKLKRQDERLEKLQEQLDEVQRLLRRKQ